VDRAQISVLEETNEVRLRRFLESADGGALETQIGLEILRDFTNQPLERQLPDQQLSRFLISSNFSKSHGTGPIMEITEMLLYSHDKPEFESPRSERHFNVLRRVFYYFIIIIYLFIFLYL